MSWLGLLVPVLFLTGYFVTYFWRRIHWLPFAVVAAGSLIFPITAYLIVFSSGIYSNGTRIVWNSAASTGEPLVIGGDSAETVVRWSNDLSSPSLKLEIQPGSRQIKANLSGGGAFLYDNNTKKYFNGNEIKPNATVPFSDGYQISRKTPGFLSWEYEILDKDGKRILANFSLQKSKPRTLAYLIAGNLADDLRQITPDKIGERDALAAWAARILVIKTDKDEVFALDHNQNKDFTFNDAEIKNLVLQSAQQKIKFSLQAEPENQKILVKFNPPYKLASALPPGTIEGCNNTPRFLRLTVANDFAPCEMLFNFPFGNKITNFRPSLFISPETLKFVPFEKANEKPNPGNQTNAGQARTVPNTETTVDYYTNVIEDCGVPVAAPETVQVGRKCEGTSQAVVSNGTYGFSFITIQNSLKTFNVKIALGLIWFIFLLGLALTFERMPMTNRWVLYGVALVVWNLLVFRLMLAFRYVLDAEAFDLLAVNGLTRSFVALVLLPGLFLLLARLHCDITERTLDEKKDRRSMIFALVYLAILFVTILSLNFYVPSLLWASLPEEFNPAWLSGKNIVLIVSSIIGALILAIGIVHLYFPDESTNKRLNRKIYNTFVLSWYWLKDLTLHFADFWVDVLQNKSRSKAEFAGTMIGRLAVYLIFCVAIFLLYWFIRSICSFIGGDKLAQETFLPLFFCMIVLFWLGLAVALRSRLKKENGKIQISLWLVSIKVFLIALVTITFTTVIAPIAILDFGSIIAVLGLLMPLCAILLAIDFWRAGIPVLVAFLIIFGVGYGFYQNLEGYIPFVNTVESYLIPGDSVNRAVARTLNFKSGLGAQEYAIATHRLTNDGGLPYQELLNGNEHVWENQAIAHEGRWEGLGFGKAPNRESEVRQDTLQYDSVYSFFVLSEYGLIGGVLLLIIYLFPLIFVFMGGRERFDVGYIFALVLASGFLLEALYHAGMNLAAFPMSGRNLPLLSVNSPSDLLKWMILLGLLGQAIFWRYEGYGQIKANAESLIEEVGEIGNTPAWKKYLPGWRRLGLALLLVVALVGGTVLLAAYSNLKNKSIEEFNYKPLLDAVHYFINEKIDGKSLLSYDKNKNEVIIDPTVKLKHSIEPQFLHEEVARFNYYLKKDSQENPNSPEKLLRDELSKVTNLQEYNKALTTVIGKTPRRPSNKSLFMLSETQNEKGEIISTHLEPNPDFNFKKDFKTGKSATDYPLVKIGERIAIGPSWSNNRLFPATNPNLDLTWLSNAAFALVDEWRQLEENQSGKAADFYGKLTLNLDLQKAATKFVTEQGVKRHQELLNEGEKYPLKLPPRVALSIINLPLGETLALGSFPRSTRATRTWKVEQVVVDKETREYLIPSTNWVDRINKRQVKDYYTTSDHNFTTGMIMGSSTKPILAAAVLAVHPGLEKRLQVRGAAGEGNSVFGLTIPGDQTWEMNSTKTGCIEFKDYLMRSDNNYHIRLGILGLAANPITHSGDSSSQDESLSGDCNKPWRKYPKFESFVQVNNREIGNLLSSSPNFEFGNSKFAQKLNGIFGINVKGIENEANRQREISFRRSFWTKNTDDDLNENHSNKVNHTLLDNVAPQVPDFKFDKTTSSRDFVTLLLGGGANSFANIDLAGAFGSCILARPVVPHIVENNTKIETKREAVSAQAAYALRTGLQAAVLEKDGTAYKLKEVLGGLLKNERIGIYAKTGTLKGENQLFNTSRIVFSIVKWKDNNRTEAETGLVFSLVIEQGDKSKAVNLLADFISQHSELIERALFDQ